MNNRVFPQLFGGNLCSLDFPVEGTNPFSLLLGRKPRNKIILAQRYFAGGENFGEFGDRANADPFQPTSLGRRILLRWK